MRRPSSTGLAEHGPTTEQLERTEAYLAAAAQAGAGLAAPGHTEALRVALETLHGSEMIAAAHALGAEGAARLRHLAGPRGGGGAGAGWWYETQTGRGVIVRRAYGAPPRVVGWRDMADALRSSGDPAVVAAYQSAYARYLELHQHGRGPDARIDPVGAAAWNAAYREATDAMRAAERAWVDAACAVTGGGQLALF